MERYLCLHGHFYQPPRENPWLEAVETQESAYPYHDWNERITAECYAPNAVARMLDAEGRISQIVNNYSKISFNFGPTLLSWLEDKSPEVYRAILEADQVSQGNFSGHGSALAQAYNHMIMPLANRRDKATQVAWGIRDFERRFGRRPEGLWLPETAVDLESLDVLAELGIRFTILAPYQAARVRKLGDKDWHDASGGRIDPTRAYLQKLPSGRSIVLFFYDGPISRAVAFEKLLTKGEHLANRLTGAFNDDRQWPQLVHIATDGETYGHHSSHGDMALAYALHHIETNQHAKLTNYGEYLEKHLPTHEVEIVENTAWSCAHGIERWRGDCGCNSGRAGWNQAWRKPLRAALDWLRDTLTLRFEEKAHALLKDPWAARDGFVDVILNRAADNVEAFLGNHASRVLAESERVAALKLLEMQRHLMLMYTSCGWFFDEISGIETVQVIQYAGRAVQLAEELFGEPVEVQFLDRLAEAKSNLREHGDGKQIYLKWVKPTMLDWERVGAHYAVSSLFEANSEQVPLFCYTAGREDLRAFEAGKAKLVVGRVRMTSTVTQETEVLSFGALHFGDHNVNCGVRKFQGEQAYETLVDDLSRAFAKADFPDIIRHLDRGFGESTYSLRSLFRDEQRKVTRQVLGVNLTQAEATYRRLYEDHLPSMRFLADMGVQLPRAFRTAAEFVLNKDLRWAFDDDEPNAEHIIKLVEEAKQWGVTIDTPGLAYRLRKTLGRMATRLRENPADLTLLKTLGAIVHLASALPFEVDLWQPQNVYFELTRTALPECQNQAVHGNETARIWAEEFLALGQTLGMQVADLKKKIAEIKRTPTLASVVDHALAHPHIPRATYRLQFNRTFTFGDAAAIVPYLHELGVSDCYVSPILKARPGSMHGYDIVDHSRLNPELGGPEAFDAFAAALGQRGMGIVLDTVPNHMGIADSGNPMWMDVLENGPGSSFAPFFDIDWHPVNPDLDGKVLLPILGDQYGAVLESGQIQLGYEEGAFFLNYYEHRLPIAPRTYTQILEFALPGLLETLGPKHEHLQELQSILTAISYLPERSDVTPERIAERNREKEVVKRRIAALIPASAEIRAAIESTIAAFNGKVGDARSFDRLDRLLEAQAYRLAFWRVAMEEINYRRFFDINELAAIAAERPEVFKATHEVTFQLLAEGKASGLRIDHCDGLWDPAGYFRRVQEEFLIHRVRAILGAERCPEGVEREVATRLAAHVERADRSIPRWPLYVITEKILGENEPLPLDWAVYGTTGYDFLNHANGIFVDRKNKDKFETIFAQFTGTKINFTELVVNSQKVIMLVSMASEVYALSHELDRISERNRRYRDFTLNSLTFAIREIVASLFIYRTYITGPDHVSPRDRTFVFNAVEAAKDRNPRTAVAVFDFIRDTLLLRNINDFAEEDRPRLIAWTMKFQQLTGPVLAKGLEDTAFYIYNRLTSLNEVGGHPERFGFALEEFHRHNEEGRKHWQHTALSTCTHDTKRSEDVRARLNVLSEMPDEWQGALARWGELNAGKKTLVDEQPAPSRNDEYLLYQSILGAWPVEPMSAQTMPGFRDRIVAYMQKATKEAKVHTSWINPVEEYDSAVREFVIRLLPDDVDDVFLKDLASLQPRITFCGFFNSLAQAVLKLTCPGVPDLYQGTELWDFSLVDPDNRRPVDYERRRQVLSELKMRIHRSGPDLLPLAEELAAHLPDGRIKMYVTYQCLNYRRARRAVFAQGSYAPLEAQGEQREHVCAFARVHGAESVVAVAPRLVYRLTDQGAHAPTGPLVWHDTRLHLPPGRAWRNLFTGELLHVDTRDDAPTLPVAAILGRFPVALLVPASEKWIDRNGDL